MDWETKMRAITTGAMLRREVDSTAAECAKVADAACTDSTPLWSDCVPGYTARLMAWGGKSRTEEREHIEATLIRCGKVADSLGLSWLVG